MGPLETWFLESKRDFPWRKERTPYRVWISEVMLQQTRASVVIPYFLRWMELFPDVKALYTAPMDLVMKTWEGLGYYRRARNLKEAASQIVERFGGEIPENKQDLMSIHGFGPYTVGAVLSFAFQKRSPAVDGNVIRVISRYFCIEEDVSKFRVRKKIEEKADLLLDEKIPWVSAEALIELGATICLPKPACEVCPLSKSCLGKQRGVAENLPLKKEAVAIESLFRIVFVVEKDGLIALKKGELGKVMEGLYEFPYLETPSKDFLRKTVLEKADDLFSPVLFVQKLSSCVHSFTRYKAHLFPYLFKADSMNESYEWVPIDRLSCLPFSSGHRKILAEVEKIYAHR